MDAHLRYLGDFICISFVKNLFIVKTKGRKKDKVNIVTLGCSKNIVDSEVMLTQLRGNLIDATHELEMDDANVVVINTCGFIDRYDIEIFRGKR